MRPSPRLARQALDDSFRLHFAKLFNVLLDDATDAGLTRFRKGFAKSAAMYAEALEVIAEELADEPGTV